MRGLRCDIVMDALAAYSGAEGPRDADGRTMRAQMRAEATAKAARAWIEEQGRKAGFALVKKPDEDDGVFLSASNYETVRIPRIQGPELRGARDVRRARLRGADRGDETPRSSSSRLANGFGKAKAFGCGLMLIRRA